MSCAQRFKKKLGTKFQLPWKLSDCFPIWRTNMTFSLFRQKKTRKRDLNLGKHAPPFFSFASRVVRLNFVYFFIVSTEWLFCYHRRYKERLETKYIKPRKQRGNSQTLVGSSWTFLEKGTDDFRDGLPPEVYYNYVKKVFVGNDWAN